MSSVNKARVWVELRVRAALTLQQDLDALRLHPYYEFEGVPDGRRRVGFRVPQDMSVQDAILKMSHLAPAGTTVYAS